jgi:hypothetical protein
MRRSKWLWGASIAVACGALALGCGRSEEPSAARVPNPAPTASTPSRAPGTDVAAPSAPSTPSAVDTCIRLADELAWSQALDSCTQAAKERPDDLKIRHALQQAQAAAAQSLAN